MSMSKFKGKKAVAFCDTVRRVFDKHGFTGGELMLWKHKDNVAVPIVQYADLLISTDGVRLFAHGYGDLCISRSGA